MRNYVRYRQYKGSQHFKSSFVLIKFSTRIILILLLSSLLGSCIGTKYNQPSSQNPSPMTETIRTHKRVSANGCSGKRIKWEILGKPVQLFIPQGYSSSAAPHLIIHFHGVPKVSEFAICQKTSQVMLTITGGSGSSSYEKLFTGTENLTDLLNRTAKELDVNGFSSLTLSGWSAGYGAIRALLRQNEDGIDNIVLLDGLHTSYIPEKQVLFEGGQLDTVSLEPFFKFAQKAAKGEKQMLITHGSIFPGTYASTTECTEYIIKKLGLKRTPVLKSGPVGMQQIGETLSGNLSILSYAGNTAPDHIDYLHGLAYFLDKVFKIHK